MKPQTFCDALFATFLGLMGALALIHWALTANVVNA